MINSIYDLYIFVIGFVISNIMEYLVKSNICEVKLHLSA